MTTDDWPRSSRARQIAKHDRRYDDARAHLGTVLGSSQMLLILRSASAHGVLAELADR